MFTVFSVNSAFATSQDELFEAIHNRDISKVESILLCRNQLSQMNLLAYAAEGLPYEGETLLTLASQVGNLKILNRLIEMSRIQEVPLSFQINEQGLSPLLTALIFGQIPVARFLLNEHYIDDFSEPMNGFTFFIKALKCDPSADLTLLQTTLFAILKKQGERAPLDVTQGSELKRLKHLRLKSELNFRSEFPEGSPCPLCKLKDGEPIELLSPDHQIHHHEFDGRFRPCPRCMYMIEKRPLAEGGETNRVRCRFCKAKNTPWDFNFNTGLKNQLDGRMTDEVKQYSLPTKTYRWPEFHSSP